MKKLTCEICFKKFNFNNGETCLNCGRAFCKECSKDNLDKYQQCERCKREEKS